MTESACPWLYLSLPANQQALEPMQALLLAQARQLGFCESVQKRMAMALDEALATSLYLSQDGGIDPVLDREHGLQLYLGIEQGALVLRLSDNGLPYDGSLLPDYNPQDAEAAGEDRVALASFLMQKLCDSCQIINQGAKGHHLQLEWRLPEKTAVSEGSMFSQGQVPDVSQDIPQASSAINIRPFQSQDAIHLARLIYSSYGYSYVNPDLYIAERIQARVDDGRLISWVALAVDAKGQEHLIGHIACMKASAEESTLEVGAAVVSPRHRGGGLLGTLLARVEQELVYRPERLALVHAVTVHPFTQKTFGRLGYRPTALLLAYAPASLHFRGISDPLSKARGGVFIYCKLLRPMSPLAVWLPEGLAPLILRCATGIAMPLVPRSDQAMGFLGETGFETQIESGLNVATLILQHPGVDCAQVLRRQLRALCRQRLDIICLHLDMGQPTAPLVSQIAMELGFILAGLMPFSPWPATLCLQYLNNQEPEEAQLYAVGEIAEELRAAIFSAWRKQEAMTDPLESAQ